MEHQDLKEALELLVCDELSPGRERLLRLHLEDCADCRREWDALKDWQAMIQEHLASPEPSEELLFQARSALQRRLRGQSSSVAGPGWRDWLSTLMAPIPRSAWVGALMLVVGLGAGAAFFSRPPQGSLPAQPSSQRPAFIANVRILDDPFSQQVELAYDEVRLVRIKGSPQDDRIRRVLAHAAVHDENAGIRLKAVDHLDRQDFSGLDEVKRTLIASLVDDENPGVRRRAMEALQKLPFDEEIRRALLQVLRYDSNAGLRVEAINALEGAALEGMPVGQEALEIVRERKAEDENNYVRRRAESFLREVDLR